MTSLLTREDLIQKSARDYLSHQLFDVRGLDPNQVTILEAFDYDWITSVANGVDKEYVAAGFNFDDGGTNLEMGSSLTSRVVSLEFLIFATTPERGENLNGHVTFAWESDPKLLPLLDYRVAPVSGSYPMFPQVDYLVVDSARGMRLPHPQPQPWQRNTWQVVVRLTDEYFADQW